MLTKLLWNDLIKAFLNMKIKASHNIIPDNNNNIDAIIIRLLILCYYYQVLLDKSWFELLKFDYHYIGHYFNFE